jgi:hypothetical protein
VVTVRVEPDLDVMVPDVPGRLARLPPLLGTLLFVEGAVVFAEPDPPRNPTNPTMAMIAAKAPLAAIMIGFLLALRGVVRPSGAATWGWPCGCSSGV